MSYRLIDSNAIAIKYPEVNEMPCVFINLPSGLNGQFIDAQPEQRWNRLMMYLADLQLTYSPGWGANGQGDEIIYEFVTGLIDELKGWEEEVT